MHDPRAYGGELEHLAVLDVAELARRFHDARIRGEDAVHVGIDLADVGVQGRRQCHGRGVGAAPAQRRDRAKLGHALETRHEDDLADF